MKFGSLAFLGLVVLFQIVYYSHVLSIVITNIVKMGTDHVRIGFHLTTWNFEIWNHALIEIRHMHVHNSTKYCTGSMQSVVVIVIITTHSNKGLPISRITLASNNPECDHASFAKFRSAWSSCYGIIVLVSMIVLTCYCI